LVVWQIFGSSGSGLDEGSGGFFSDDDGKTWFEASADKIPPWDRNGKTAVRCYVFTCDGGKTKFAGYLERLTPEAKRMLEGQHSGAGGAVPIGAANPLLAGMGVEIKPPLTGSWLPKADPRAMAIIAVKCPPGTSGTPELVMP
jgi:hypothetical protein